MLSDEQIGDLLHAARDGARHAFLTKPGGVRYGASVLTTAGRIHRSGQYSSFNHSTNVHAEMGALAVAAAAGDADVIALLLVSTAATSTPARPCGVCRQVIAEHARRVGRPIEVLMASWDGRLVERMTSEELLPSSWTGGGEHRDTPWVAPDPASAAPLAFGDHLVIAPQMVGMVWAVDGDSTRAMMKVKYAGLRKLSHSYTEWSAYQRELAEFGLGEVTAWGDRAVIVEVKACPRMPRVPAAMIGLDRLRTVLEILPQPFAVTGSHALGIARADSDIDIVLDRGLDDETCARLCGAILAGEGLRPPDGSSTWARLEQLPGGAIRQVREHRFCDTFMAHSKDGWCRVSLIWSTAATVAGRWAGGRVFDVLAARGAVRGPLRGRVASIEARGKPAVWSLETASGLVRVATWHKDGVRLRRGDDVEICGISTSDLPLEVHQFDAARDWLRWGNA